LVFEGTLHAFAAIVSWLINLIWHSFILFHSGWLAQRYDMSADCRLHGCVRGQHGRGQGQDHKILSSRSRPVLEDPHTWAFFYRATLRGERLWHVVCLSFTLKFNALLPPLVRLCMNYEVLYLWYWVLYLPYSKIQRLTARSRSQSQDRASSRPRPGIFKAKATKFCPRAVLEVEASPRLPHPWQVVKQMINLIRKTGTSKSLQFLWSRVLYTLQRMV